MPDVPIAVARETAFLAMRGLGWDEESARVQADVMLWAELHGSNQGLTKLASPQGMAPAPGAGKPVLERVSAVSAVVDGRGAPGMLALRLAVDTAVAKARGGAGVALVGVRRTTTSSGMLAYFGERLAASGLVGILFATSPEKVSMVPGGAGVFGTNPVCFAFPTPAGRPPFVVDFATAAIAYYGVLRAKGLGQALPPGCAFDPDGRPTTDPDLALAGTLGAFGAHKGAALALCVELLGSALPGAGVVADAANPKAQSWGHTVIALDPALLVDGFAERVATVLAAVKASHPDGVRLPGESSGAVAARNEQGGTLALPDNLWEGITQLAAQHPKKAAL
jgi:LDH2 family malate/lactate/ureidoglycolate dehydrogenase